jgi:Uma2 family endonuclease
MWAPDPMRQRLADYTVEDVLNLPEDAPPVELLDGVIYVVPSPSIGHQDIGHLLWSWFRTNVPKGHHPAGPVSVIMDDRNTRQPDLVLLRDPVVIDDNRVTPDQVVIAVEVVSPGTRKRDRFEKPGLYASAGIPYYWRVEQDPVHVYAYGLRDGAYQLLADADTTLKLDEPFPINLPVQAITP